jgi:Flp pilus assembly protein TadG
MRIAGRDKTSPQLSREEGTAALETVMLFPVIALVVLAILEFGHLWQVRHVLTIASREGARAAVVFQPGSEADRINWATVNGATDDGNPTGVAQATVNNYLKNTAHWKSGDWTVPDPIVTLGPSGTLTGGTLTVRVQTNNALLVLHKLIKDISIVEETTMRFE